MIDSEQKLAELLPKIEKAPWVAIDTEADSLHAYPEKLCLLQISIPNHDWLVDPLARFDMAPLLGQFRNHELILHGADYDLRMLFRTYQFVPHTIFDTMLAARLLGYTEFGLTHLVLRCLGVQLEKGPQKMNWAQRPLPERMEIYARNDTRYLFPLAELLTKELQEKGRLSWLQESCAQLIKECAQERVTDPEQVWRIKGSDRLDRRGLAILRELFAWRETEAVESNKPPYFVLSHETLVSVAGAGASGRPAAELVPTNLSARRQGRFLIALERGISCLPKNYPKLRRSIGHRLTHQQQARFDQLKTLRDQQAAKLGIDATIIASRAMLVALSQDWEAVDSGLMSWQRDLLTK